MSDNISVFVSRIKFIRDQTSAILNELDDNIEEYRAALEDMNGGLTEALAKFENYDDDPTNPSGGVRRKRKVRKTRKTRRS